MQVQPVTLHGRLVRLEPLAETHVPGLAQVGLDERIWRYMRYGDMRSEADMRQWVRGLLELQAKGTDLPFAVLLQQDGQVAGSTRYLNIDPENRAVEIGGTWYGLQYQRTGVNTECKYLLLGHAFEALGCVRVQLKTDARNLASQRAIERIGAVKEGVLRQHMILPDGAYRDSVFYSILDNEWPGVKAHLELLMKQYDPGAEG
jgi:RimJ/RimL family protein N-acetyltransferase